jgi:DNA-binding LacI/PurR family transcriptional regulator
LPASRDPRPTSRLAEPSRPRRAGLVDVTRAAGTSPPIASRIINADPTLSVRQALRERILTAAKDLGYRPPALARSLWRTETGAVGMLVSSLMNPVYTHVIRGAFARASERDFTVLLAEDYDKQEADETFARLVLSGRIDGLIVASARRVIRSPTCSWPTTCPMSS